MLVDAVQTSAEMWEVNCLWPASAESQQGSESCLLRWLPSIHEKSIPGTSP